MKKILFVWLAALVALPIMAQSFVDKDQPTATFQSTSVMQTSGSVYASQPAINEDGTAVYNAAEGSQSQLPGGGPRKVAPVTPTGVSTPIGDAVLPLMLMAVAFTMFVYFRRKQTLKS